MPARLPSLRSICIESWMRLRMWINFRRELQIKIQASPRHLFRNIRKDGDIAANRNLDPHGAAVLREVLREAPAKLARVISNDVVFVSPVGHCPAKNMHANLVFRDPALPAH